MASSEASALIAVSHQSAVTTTPSLARTYSDHLQPVDSKFPSVSPPRPRWWYLLPSLAVVDLCCSIALAIPVVEKKSTVVLLVWSCLRAAAVGTATCSVRVREMGWVTVACGVLSALASLADLNVITQHRAWLKGHRGPPLMYCLSHLCFGMVHWLAFAIIVGITPDRNPYGLGLRSTIRPAWRDSISNIAVRSASGAFARAATSDWDRQMNDRHMANEASFAQNRYSDASEDELDDEAQYNDGEEGDQDAPIDRASDESDTDPDDIIDIIPSPSTSRHRRVSQARSYRSISSLRARNPSQFQEAESPENQGHLYAMGGSRQYGTFRSLGGV